MIYFLVMAETNRKLLEILSTEPGRRYKLQTRHSLVKGVVLTYYYW